MKYVLSAGLGLCVLAQPVIAADLPIKAPPSQAPVAAVFDWSGFYVGVDAGKLKSRAELLIASNVVAKPNPDGSVLGGHLGYRQQLPSGVVWGVELDGWRDSKGERIDPYSNAPGQGGIDLRWGGSARAQLGYAYGPLLGYLTGGAAYISYEGCAVHNVLTPCLTGTLYSGDSWGWTWGTGLAFALTNNLSVRVEYLYADYGREPVSTPGVAGGRTLIDLRTRTVRAGVSWKFATR
jgi:outer membrane immunogenic protein